MESKPKRAPFNFGRFGLIALGIATLAVMAFFLAIVSLGAVVSSDQLCECGFSVDVESIRERDQSQLTTGLVIWAFALVGAFALERKISNGLT